MTRGTQALTITVIPDSGTGELAGITRTMTIDIRDGKHFYGIDYRCPERRATPCATGSASVAEVVQSRSGAALQRCGTAADRRFDDLEL